MHQVLAISVTVSLSPETPLWQLRSRQRPSSNPLLAVIHQGKNGANTNGHVEGIIKTMTATMNRITVRVLTASFSSEVRFWLVLFELRCAGS